MEKQIGFIITGICLFTIILPAVASNFYFLIGYQVIVLVAILYVYFVKKLQFIEQTKLFLTIIFFWPFIIRTADQVDEGCRLFQMHPLLMFWLCLLGVTLLKAGERGRTGTYL